MALVKPRKAVKSIFQMGFRNKMIKADRAKTPKVGSRKWIERIK